MNKNNPKCRKGFWNLPLPFEAARLTQLQDEFYTNTEIADLFRKNRAIYEEIRTFVPDEKHVLLLDFEANNNHILARAQTIFFKLGFIDCSKIMQFLIRCKNNIKMSINIT